MSNSISNVYSAEEKRMDGALRLFEALSGVDEELLAKCEAKPIGKAKRQHLNKQKIFSFMHGGAVLVAAVCVLAVGVYAWQMNGPMFISKKAASNADCAAGIEYAADVEAPAAMQEAITEAEMAMPEAAPAETEMFDAGTEEMKEIGDAVTEKNQAKQEDLQQCILESVMDSGAAKDTRMEVTEAEARQMAVLGEYVPTVLPAGYIWESGKLSGATEAASERVFLVWTRGMDYIELAITRVDVAELQLTDITAEETYNVHLYDIPYAETIPEEYRDTFNNPVFMAEDLSLELIEKRMKSFGDAGDTDTPRGNFSVLYENGVLVDFGGRGTAQEIWEMFESMDL